MAKGRKTSLAVRALALVFALALAALAARLWLGDAPRSDAPPVASGAAEQDEAAVSAEPPLHEEIPAEDREALRELLREEARP